MITKINNHTNTIENALQTGIAGAQDEYKSELQRTINLVKEENTKVFTMLEELKTRMGQQEALIWTLYFIFINFTCYYQHKRKIDDTLFGIHLTF